MKFILETNSKMYGRDVLSGNDGHGYATLSEVSAAYCELRDFTDEGGSTFSTGIVRDENGKHVYNVSYNGRVWETDSRQLPDNSFTGLAFDNR